jgi:hypothetical protein
VTDQNVPGTTRREFAAFALLLAGVSATVLFLTDGGILLTRPFWVDEVIAALIASRPTPVSVLGDLGNGADGGASLFHVGLWTVRAVTGSLAPFLLRLLTLACVLAALLLIHAVLRRGFSPTAAAAGSLAVGANTLVIEHAYDARFYAPWLLACALLAWLFGRRQSQPSSRNAWALALTAIAVCTIHFYGIITLTLMAFGALAVGWPRWRERIPVVKPAAWGLLSLLVVVPLAFAQRRAYTVPSWLPDFAWPQLSSMLAELWLAKIPLTAAIIILVAGAMRMRRDATTGTSFAFIRAALSDSGVASLAALLLVPFALATLSLLGQPSMLSRYAIAAVLVWGPWVAIAVTLLGRWGGRLAIVVIAGFWFVAYTRATAVRSAFARSVGEQVASFDAARRAQPNLPVVFASMHVMYATLWPDRLSDPRAAFLEVEDATLQRWFPDSTLVGQLNRGVILERDLTRVHARRMAFPKMVSREALNGVPAFFVQGAVSRLPVGFASVDQYMKAMFPAHTVRRLQADLLLLEKQGGPPTTK